MVILVRNKGLPQLEKENMRQSWYEIRRRRGGGTGPHTAHARTAPVAAEYCPAAHWMQPVSRFAFMKRPAVQLGAVGAGVGLDDGAAVRSQRCLTCPSEQPLAQVYPVAQAHVQFAELLSTQTPPVPLSHPCVPSLQG